MDIKEIEKENEELGLPRVILEHGDYRFVATTVISGQVEKTDRAWSIIMLPSQSIVRIESEASSRDSLGKVRWTSCNFNTAKEYFFEKKLDEGFNGVEVAFKQQEKTKATKIK